MATWGELAAQIASAREAPVRVYDEILHKALSELSSCVEAPVILYASGFLQKEGYAPVSGISMTADDLTGFMEVVHGIQGRRLFLVLHSPGGSAEAAEGIVKYLRSKFSEIVVLVPHQAKSAATMLACAADRVIMAKHSELGPIDPQFILQTPLGWRAVPGQSIRNQFKRASEEILANQSSALLWYPMLAQYGPGLLDEVEKAMQLSKTLVTAWLSSYMFRRRKNGPALAANIADYLTNWDEHATHGRPLAYTDLKARGMKVSLMEDNQQLQDCVMTVYHAAMHAFADTPTTKIIQNHLHKGYVRILRTPTGETSI